MKNWSEIFIKTDIDSVELPVFNKIGNEWFLITAGDLDNFNTMTASWGTLGILWNKPIAICFVRPTRYTFNFMEDSDIFTMSFLGKENRKILNYCGSVSGRDSNKIKETGLSPISMESNGISFEQANLVFECRKIYFDDIKPIFILPEDIDEKNYPEKDYHRMYFGEITGIYRKK
jgi:flavin reductase (DIM6/NTAB) family NADH-FMN oxidoreductase RutF